MFVLALFAQVFAGSNWNPSWSELSANQGWKLHQTVKRSTGNVSVYKKMIQGNPCFKGTTVVQNMDYKVLLEIATDIESAKQWSSAGIKEAVTLQRNSTSIDYYQYIDLPLISDRFWFLRGYFEQANGVITFRWERLPQGGPHKKIYEQVKTRHPSAVEPVVNIGAWRFTPRAEQLTISYLLCTHPGGSIPTSLQAVGTAKTLPNNLEDVIKEGRRRGR